MRTTDLYNSPSECCGCEACSQVCPRKIINMIQDPEGFMYPKIINEENCIKCGKCQLVCPSKSPGRKSSEHRISFGGYILDNREIAQSASGGFAYVLYKSFINNNGIVYGVQYSDDYLSVKYSRADKINDIDAFRGSKYIQANKEDVYKNVLSDLRYGYKVLFIGLPCEVSALYHFVGKHIENLYTVSLICHGPTSQKVHQSFCKETFNEETISYFSLRYKLSGWKPYYIKANYGDDKEFLKPFINTPYDDAFKYLKRPSCATCRYKMGDKEFGIVADIVIGDFHGVSISSDIYNNWGVSQVSVFTTKGEFLCKLIHDKAKIDLIPFNIIKVSNTALVSTIPNRKLRHLFSRIFIKQGLYKASNHPLIKTEIKIRLFKKWLIKTLINIRTHIRIR